MPIPKEIIANHVIIPVIKSMSMYSESAVNLILGTAAVESDMGHYLKQLSGGPARGIFGMEPVSYNDIVDNWLCYREPLKNHILKSIAICGYDFPNFYEITNNYWLAAAMCRIHYYRFSEPLPSKDDVSGMARYWKKYYNTAKGKGTEKDFIEKYNYYVK